MNSDWVMKVLADLEVFAEANGLPRLARKIAEVIETAEDEIRSAGYRQSDSRKGSSQEDFDSGK